MAEENPLATHDLLIRRMLVFLIGAITVWLIVVFFVDVADRSLPLIAGIALTYGFAAYIALPRAIRLGSWILNREQVPSYTLTNDGLPGDPINIALIGSKRQLQDAFAAIGWAKADRLSLVSSWKMCCAFALGRNYATAPFSTLHLLGRGQDSTIPTGHRCEPTQAPSRPLLGADALPRRANLGNGGVLVGVAGADRRRAGCLARRGHQRRGIVSHLGQPPGHARDERSGGSRARLRHP